MRRFFRCLLILTLLAACSAAQADEYFTGGAGWFNFNRGEKNSANFSGEWRGDQFFYGFRPVVGAMVNTDGGAYGYAGLNYDWQFMPHWALVPGADIGAWGRGHSLDLGGTFEFHESVELDYIFDNNYRLGAEVTHTSNAGIYDTNPGVNTVMATVSIPLR